MLARYHRPQFGRDIRNRDIPDWDRDLSAMRFWNHIVSYTAAIREFVAPTYRPERYYMRGPGPACARRGHSFGAGAH